LPGHKGKTPPHPSEDATEKKGKRRSSRGKRHTASPSGTTDHKNQRRKGVADKPEAQKGRILRTNMSGWEVTQCQARNGRKHLYKKERKATGHACKKGENPVGTRRSPTLTRWGHA